MDFWIYINGASRSQSCLWVSRIITNHHKIPVQWREDMSFNIIIPYPKSCSNTKIKYTLINLHLALPRAVPLETTPYIGTSKSTARVLRNPRTQDERDECHIQWLDPSSWSIRFGGDKGLDTEILLKHVFSWRVYTIYMCFCWRLFGFMVGRLRHPVKNTSCIFSKDPGVRKNPGSEKKNTTFHLSTLHLHHFCWEEFFFPFPTWPIPGPTNSSSPQRMLGLNHSGQDFLAVLIGTDLPHPSQRFSRDLWGEQNPTYAPLGVKASHRLPTRKLRLLTSESR